MEYLNKLYNMQVDKVIFDENTAVDLYKPNSDPIPMLCATEYQNHPPFFKLPAASPYDNFLKAAGC